MCMDEHVSINTLTHTLGWGGWLVVGGCVSVAGNLSTTLHTHSECMVVVVVEEDKGIHIHAYTHRNKLCLPSRRMFTPPTWHTVTVDGCLVFPCPAYPPTPPPYFRPSTDTHARQRTLYNKCWFITHSHSHTRTLIFTYTQDNLL